MAICKSIASGDKFNNLTFLSECAPKNGRRSAVFRCDCGTEKTMLIENVRSGRSTTCGCLSKQNTVARSTKHGHAKRGAHSRAYGTWENMVARCTLPSRPDYSRYGGRGIKVCERWLESFENFYADVGDPMDGMTLDRYPDVNGNYEPSNVRWATSKEQANNRRSNVFIEHKGKRQNIEAWSVELGISRHVIEGRVRRGETDPVKIFGPLRQTRLLEFNCKSQTVSQWAAEIGLSVAGINNRLQKGLPIDEVLRR